MTEPVDLNPIVWENLATLMTAQWGEPNITRLARESGIGPATGQRIKDMDTSTGTKVLAKVALTLKVHPWQLLVPNLDAKSLPRIDRRPISPPALDLATTLDKIQDPQKKQAAYAIALAAIRLADSGGAAEQPPSPLR